MKVLNDTVLNLYVAVAKRSPIYKWNIWLGCNDLNFWTPPSTKSQAAPKPALAPFSGRMLIQIGCAGSGLKTADQQLILETGGILEASARKMRRCWDFCNSTLVVRDDHQMYVISD